MRHVKGFRYEIYHAIPLCCAQAKVSMAKDTMWDKHPSYTNSRYSPQLDSAINACNGKGLPIWTKRYTPNSLCMSYKHLKLLSSLNIPQLNGLITTATSKGLSIWTEDYSSNPVCMTFECTKLLPSLNIPQLNGLITTAT